MFLFSPILLLYNYITQTSIPQQKVTKNSIPSVPLYLLPYLSGCYNNVILIYKFFYNVHKTLLQYMNNTRNISAMKPPNHQRKKRMYPAISIHHLFFFVYALMNLTIALGIHFETLPLYSLGFIPTAIGSISIFSKYNKRQQYHFASFKQTNQQRHTYLSMIPRRHIIRRPCQPLSTFYTTRLYR